VRSVMGQPQPQAAVLGTVMAGSKGSAMAFLMGRDILMPGTGRLYMDPIISAGYFAQNNAYIVGNPAFAGERAGSNESSAADYVTGNGWDLFVRYKFKYLLPIGDGQDPAASPWNLQDGLLVSGATGGESWNPLASGRTFVELRPFYRSLQIHSDTLDTDLKTSGLDASLFWDNRDLPANPTRGNGARFRVSRDFGALGSSGPWTVLEGEGDFYHSFGDSGRFLQQVLAVDVWAAYSPTWEAHPDGSISGNPPAYTGATLGGLFRLRGYPTQRFSDKAADYLGAEYRIIPNWNPFDRWPGLQRRMGVQWLQFAVFAEAGRVAPGWEAQALTRAMKWDAGLGVRILAKGLVARIDVCRSPEDTRVQMMVGQPFQF